MDLTINNRFDFLLEDYAKERASIINIQSAIDSIQEEIGWSSYQSYFNRNRDNLPNLNLFVETKAIDALNRKYWVKALEETRLLNYVSNDKRNEILQELRSLENAPDFVEENIKSTLSGLIKDLPKLIAERVDGIFRALSREHFTNRPEGFNTRMIIYVADTSWGWSPNSRMCGYLSELCSIISQMKGGDAVNYNFAHNKIRDLTGDWGEWQDFYDGVKIRVYKKGTAHLEIDNNIANDLNSILASLYPDAVADKSRAREPVKSTRKVREHGVDSIQLGISTVNEIRSANVFQYGSSWNVTKRGQGGFNKNVIEVFKLLGAIPDSKWGVKFGYNPEGILNYLGGNGVIPDFKTHQFYPTPKEIAEKAREMLGDVSNKSVLEPSAGLGYLVDGLKAKSITCIDIAPAFVEVLKSKGYTDVLRGDFLQYAESNQFDAIIMNPPFDNNQAHGHILKAYKHLRYGGKLVAIMPESYRGKVIVPSAKHEYSELMTGFDKTSVNVVIVKLTK